MNRITAADVDGARLDDVRLDGAQLGVIRAMHQPQIPNGRLDHCRLLKYPPFHLNDRGFQKIAVFPVVNIGKYVRILNYMTKILNMTTT